MGSGNNRRYGSQEEVGTENMSSDAVSYLELLSITVSCLLKGKKFLLPHMPAASMF